MHLYEHYCQSCESNSLHFIAFTQRRFKIKVYPNHPKLHGKYEKHFIFVRPNVEISMFPVILPYGIFVGAHSHGNTFPKFSNTEPKKIIVIYLQLPADQKCPR